MKDKRYQDPEYRERSLEKIRKWHREDRKANPEKRRARDRRSDLKRNYNLTVDAYDQMLIDQSNVCAICGNPSLDKRLAVDHDRACCPGKKSCGKCIRALLCASCNQGLGRFKDSPELLHKAATYIERHKRK